MKRTTTFATIATAMLLGFAGAVLLYKSEKIERGDRETGKNQAILPSDHSPKLGNENAKVHIIEFLDPACETCAAFYPHVKRIMTGSPDKIRLSIRHVPFHNGSDYVVKVLEASRKQDKYWQTLEALLASQAEWTIQHTAAPDLVWKALARVGLNLEQAKAEMNSSEIAQRIAQDLRDAKTLNVTKTPGFFVNGRPLQSFGLEQLQNLVQEELRR